MVTANFLFLVTLLFGSVFGIPQAMQPMNPPHPIEEVKIASNCPLSELANLASGALYTSYSGLDISVSGLPEDTCYVGFGRTFPAVPHELTIYPNMGEQDYSGSYDFSIVISVELLHTDVDSQKKCASPVGYEDLRSETLDIGQYRVKIRHDLDYSYESDAPYSNPNPYSGEIKDKLLEITRSIKLGSCF